MKSVWTLLVLAVTLAGFGAGCGPKETYCYDEHKSCAQVKADLDEAERIRQEMLKDGGTPSEGGAVFVDASALTAD